MSDRSPSYHATCLLGSLHRGKRGLGHTWLQAAPAQLLPPVLVLLLARGRGCRKVCAGRSRLQAASATHDGVDGQMCALCPLHKHPEACAKPSARGLGRSWASTGAGARLHGPLTPLRVMRSGQSVHRTRRQGVTPAPRSVQAASPARSARGRSCCGQQKSAWPRGPGSHRGMGSFTPAAVLAQGVELDVFCLLNLKEQQQIQPSEDY